MPGERRSEPSPAQTIESTFPALDRRATSPFANATATRAPRGPTEPAARPTTVAGAFHVKIAAPLSPRYVTFASTANGTPSTVPCPITMGAGSSTGRETKRICFGVFVVVVAVYSSQSRVFPPAYDSQSTRRVATPTSAIPAPVLGPSSQNTRPANVQVPRVAVFQRCTFFRQLPGTSATYAIDAFVRARSRTTPGARSVRPGVVAATAADVTASEPSVARARTMDRSRRELMDGG